MREGTRIAVRLPFEPNAPSPRVLYPPPRRHRIPVNSEHMHEPLPVSIGREQRSQHRRSRGHQGPSRPPNVEVVDGWKRCHRPPLSRTLLAEGRDRQPLFNQSAVRHEVRLQVVWHGDGNSSCHQLVQVTRQVEQLYPPRIPVLRSSAQPDHSRRAYRTSQPHPGFAHGSGYHAAPFRSGGTRLRGSVGVWGERENAANVPRSRQRPPTSTPGRENCERLRIQHPIPDGRHVSSLGAMVGHLEYRSPPRWSRAVLENRCPTPPLQVAAEEHDRISTPNPENHGQFIRRQCWNPSDGSFCRGHQMTHGP